VTPNGLELSGPAKTRSVDRAAVAGSVGDPGVLPGLQRVVRRQRSLPVGEL